MLEAGNLPEKMIGLVHDEECKGQNGMVIVVGKEIINFFLDLIPRYGSTWTSISELMSTGLRRKKQQQGKVRENVICDLTAFLRGLTVHEEIMPVSGFGRS